MNGASMRPLALGFQSLNISTATRTSMCPTQLPFSSARTRPRNQGAVRTFTVSSRAHDWLRPARPEKRKSHVGRPRLQRGGSIRGTTVVWGDYGLRMKDHDRRISSKQLQLGYDTIQRKLRGMNFKLYTRVSANIGVYTKGNEVRMGKGKGKFDYWAARVPVSRVVFELSGMVHEKVVREAFRLAGHKLPGMWEFVKKGDPPVVGVTKLGDRVTLESLKEPRKLTPIEDREGQSGDTNTVATHLLDEPPTAVGVAGRL